jgi:hypothetical protein
MDIQFPEEQFKNAMPDGYIPGWRHRFMVCVAKGLIMHDRASTAIKEPTRKNIIRSALGGFFFGTAMARDSRVNNSIVRKRYPKLWDSLVSDEVNRILDLTNS